MHLTETHALNGFDVSTMLQAEPAEKNHALGSVFVVPVVLILHDCKSECFCLHESNTETAKEENISGCQKKSSSIN